MRILHDVLPPSRRGLVCLVGAGGKSSLLHAMAGEATGVRTLVTTTTKMFRWQLESCGPLVLDLEGGLAAFGPQNSHVVATASAVDEDGKARGLTPEQVDDIHLRGRFTHVLVEADGAHGMDLKAPGPYEPVLPVTTTAVLCVVGLGSLGRPIDMLHVHRPDAVVRATGQELGDRVSEDTLARILETYRSVTSSLAPAAVCVSVLNQADRHEHIEIARKVAARVSRGGNIALITAATSVDCVVELWTDGSRRPLGSSYAEARES